VKRIGVLLFLFLLLPVCTWAANDFQRSPWLIDTAGASPITGSLSITSIRWVNVGSPGDTLILVDTTGRKILQTTAPAGATEFEVSLPFSVNKGLVINRIDSGLLFITFQ
jgi:hypothetical protein